MITFLVEHPVLLLFIVSGLGFVLGRISIAGVQLGVSGVLFVGIALSAWQPSLELPEFVSVLGLGLFVYTLGLGSGPALAATFRSHGLRDNILVSSMICVGFALTLLMNHYFQFSDETNAGVFSGGLSSAASLAAVVEVLKGSLSGPNLQRALSDSVVAYSVTYPVSFIAAIIVMALFLRMTKVDLRGEARALKSLGFSSEEYVTCALRVTHSEAVGKTLAELQRAQKWNVVFGRRLRDARVSVVADDDVVELGDELSVVGGAEDVEQVVANVGEKVPDTFARDISEFDLRRIFVSEKSIAGKRIRDLNIKKRFGARITRVRRGDVDLLPTSDMRLELGDRVRVLARHEDMPVITRFFGDSYKKLSEIDIAVFSVGLALGLLLGSANIPLPSGGHFRLGSAGGPLIAGLFFGSLRRTGPIVWHLPYSANLTLRQFGLIVFLAAMGLSAGKQFYHTIVSDPAFAMRLATFAMSLSFLTTVAFLYIGFYLLKIPASMLLGLCAGLHTQASIVSYATEQTKNDIPTLGYASVYPASMILKMLLAQLLVS